MAKTIVVDTVWEREWFLVIKLHFTVPTIGTTVNEMT